MWDRLDGAKRPRAKRPSGRTIVTRWVSGGNQRQTAGSRTMSLSVGASYGADEDGPQEDALA